MEKVLTMAGSFWRGAAKIALNVLTVGATGKVDAVREEAEVANGKYQAAYERMSRLQEQMKSLAEKRGEANRLAHADLQIVVAVLNALGRANSFKAGAVEHEWDLAVTKIQETIVSFNTAIELVTATTAGLLTSAGAWAAVSTFGVASTGTAIGSLSGAAASNAALAWFGGGSLATGGGGIALGSAAFAASALLPLIGVAAWLGHRSADKAIAELKPEIEKTEKETGRLTRLADAIERECDRMSSILGRTTSLRDELRTALLAFHEQVVKLQELGITLSDAMNENGFDRPLTDE